METLKNHQLQNLPTTACDGGIKVTLYWNLHHAPNSKTRILILSRTGVFLQKIFFYKVLLIQELANQFREIFCHLTVTQVWLLWKCKSGNGFQGWHQDKLTGVSNTIMVNLGGSNNDNNNEKDDMQKSLANNVPVLRKEAMGNNYNKVEEGDGANIIVNKEAAVRKELMENINPKHETSAVKAMKVCGRAALKSGVGIGALVSLKVDYHTHCHAQGLFAIVYRFQENLGGILVCCEHGIITHDGSTKDYWVPYDKYRVIAGNDSTFPISENYRQCGTRS
jgi:hypothetical protein